MKEYLSYCIKWFKALVKIDLYNYKIRRASWLMVHSDDWLETRIYDQTVRTLKNERDDLVEMADDLIYEMEEKGWIK